MYIIYFFVLICTTSIFADTPPDTGTMIVSYNTGEECERLSRVRFLLISENNEETMYPKGDAFVESLDCKSRVVAIHDLHPGTYRLKFIVPNADHLFDPIPERTVEIKKGEIVKIEQSLPLNAQAVIIRRPHGGIIINQTFSPVSVSSNMPNARWTLIRDNVPVYIGKGPINDYQVLNGNNYRIIPEPIEGYAFKVNPPDVFSVYPGEKVRINILYERLYGTLSIQASFPANEILTINLSSPMAAPQSFNVKSSGGKINWVSKPLPTGPYEVSFGVPKKYNPPPREQIIIRHNERLQLTPQLISNGVLHISANIPEAVFLLKSLKDGTTLQGEGREYDFQNVPAGTYTLMFTTQGSEYYIPPKDVWLTLNGIENREVTAAFQIAGKLNVATNIEQGTLTAQELGGLQKTYQEQILNGNKSMILPAGRYKLTLSPPRGDSQIIEVTIAPLKTEEVNMTFTPKKTAPQSVTPHLTLMSNIPNSGFSLYKISSSGQELIGKYSGKSAQTPLPSAGRYQVVFDDVPNYQTPEKIIIEVKPGEENILQATYAPVVAMLQIPAGKSILGAPSSQSLGNEQSARVVEVGAFAISAYEVTNAQYATWLNRAAKAGAIVYVAEADRRGQVLDMEGHLLFKTFEADAYSQISAQKQSADGFIFMPLAGKDAHPVINVSWYGASAYCKDNRYRLPTEAEWEKAGGMAPETPGAPLKKFSYGFGKDTIDPTWANYKANDASIQNFQVLTTPVGFYNGVNSLPLSTEHKTQQQTHLAKSPYGAYDMSGNVWEWVSDWSDSTATMKIVKGGCYDSLADGVRISERLALSPDHTDAYTGFRISQ